VSKLPFANSTDVTLADGDTKPILTDNANRAIPGNVAMYVTHQVNLVVKFLTKVVPSGGKFATNASRAIWWSNLEKMHVFGINANGAIW